MGKMKEKAIEEMNAAGPDAPVESKEVVTEVTTIAEQEKKSGQKLQMPTGEELVAQASGSVVVNRKHLAVVLDKLGKNALKRFIMATLDLPQDNIPVKMIKNEEKAAFRLGQGIIRGMFTVMFHHTAEAIKKNHDNNLKKENESCKTTDQKPTTQSVQDGSTKEKKASTSQ